MRDDRAPAERSGAPERPARPAPANESSGGGGFGLGVFEPKPASVRPSAPLPREKPAAEKPRETPRPQRDEGGSFGAGIE